MRTFVIALGLVFIAYLVNAREREDDEWEHECEHGCVSVPEINASAIPKGILLIVALYFLASASSKRRE